MSVLKPRSVPLNTVPALNVAVTENDVWRVDVPDGPRLDANVGSGSVHSRWKPELLAAALAPPLASTMAPDAAGMETETRGRGVLHHGGAPATDTVATHTVPSSAASATSVTEADTPVPVASTPKSDAETPVTPTVNVAVNTSVRDTTTVPESPAGDENVATVAGTYVRE